MANSVDPEQTPRSAASDLGVHYLLRAVCPILGYITKTYLYNFKPTFIYIGVYFSFLVSAQRHRSWVLEAVLTSTNNLCFE